jgi:hypothetical protein
MCDYPRKIIVLRHAEPTIEQRGQRLSSIGRERAASLAAYIPRNFGKPDVIFALAPTTSLHSLLTVLPLWQDLDDVPLDVSCDGDELRILARYIVRQAEPIPGSRFAGRNVLICWDQTGLPALMTALGAPAHTCPDPWPESDFSSVYVLVRDNEKIIASRYEMPY